VPQAMRLDIPAGPRLSKLQGRCCPFQQRPFLEARLTDPHQINSIIASAICDCRKEHPENSIQPDEAKVIAKCIVEALSNAGFKIALSSRNTGS
jgi:hypothetical protein